MDAFLYAAEKSVFAFEMQVHLLVETIESGSQKTDLVAVAVVVVLEKTETAAGVARIVLVLALAITGVEAAALALANFHMTLVAVFVTHHVKKKSATYPAMKRPVFGKPDF